MTSYARRALTVVFSIVSLVFAHAQEPSQIVRGIVSNKFSARPLAGANITLVNTAFSEGAVSDEEGRYAISNVPPGRYKVTVSFTGYATYQEELLVIAGKNSVMNIALEENSFVLSEVVIEESPVNAGYMPGLREISIEKTLRTPANFFDPVRTITSYPNVVAANDQANAIIVKGNSPNGLLWRLNGLDIVNPNHLANAGTLSDKPVANGGGVNILSAQMLDRTNFYSGAFPVAFGNALAGVFDMRLRDGNKRENEFTAQASLIGLDFSAEGPLTKSQNNSFLVNYRYSTVGLLSAMGVNFGDEEISFQDLSFNLSFDQKKGGKLTLFGLGGLSKNDFAGKKTDEIEEDKDQYNINYDAGTFALGMSYNKPVGNKGAMAVSIGYSSSEHERTANSTAYSDKFNYRLQFDDYLSKRSLLSSHVSWRGKITDKTNIQIGTLVNFQKDDIYLINNFGSVVGATIPFTRRVEGELESIAFQPYANIESQISEKFNIEAGVRYFHYTYNNTDAFEPRIALELAPDIQNKFHLSYRLVSQAQLPVTYLALANSELELTKAHHAELGFHRQLSTGINLNSAVFYQSLFDVPVEDTPFSTFSTLNLLEGYTPGYLVNKGTGENYGVNVAVEKAFFNDHYFIVGLGYYESKYTGGDGIKRDTRFNGNYTITSTHGKEFRNEEKHRTIGVNTRLLYLGGLRDSNVNETRSRMHGETRYDGGDPFSDKLKNYFRVDLRISLRKDKPGYTRTLALDIQNLTSRQNEAYQYFDFVRDKTVMKYQLGIIPVLVYRIDF